MYLIQMNDNKCTCKCELNVEKEEYILRENELEVTEEQYNSIQLPCTVIIKDNKLISWEHYEITVEPYIPPKTSIELLQEENTRLWDTIQFLLEAGGYIPNGVIE